MQMGNFAHLHFFCALLGHFTFRYFFYWVFCCTFVSLMCVCVYAYARTCDAKGEWWR